MRVEFQAILFNHSIDPLNMKFTTESNIQQNLISLLCKIFENISITDTFTTFMSPRTSNREQMFVYQTNASF